MKKRKLISGEGYPFIDHYTIYSYKRKNQKGPAKEEQTFKNIGERLQAGFSSSKGKGWRRLELGLKNSKRLNDDEWVEYEKDRIELNSIISTRKQYGDHVELKRAVVPDFFRLCNGAGRCCNNTGALADNGSSGAGLDGGERDAIRGVGEDAPYTSKCNRPDFFNVTVALNSFANTHVLIYQQTRHLSSHHHLDCVQ